MHPQVSVIVPLYNEEKVFSKLIGRLDGLASSLDYAIEFILVDDGSNDNTPELMHVLGLANPLYKCVFLSRNYGHQIAVSAGMQQASGTNAVFIIDGDLQDPPELLDSFYKKIKEGYDVVYAIRRKRKEGPFKKFAYWLFYRLLLSISDVKIPLDSGDFCMVSRKVNDIIVAMPEQSRFIRGLRTWVGFKQFGFEYERDKRVDGEAKYTYKALFKLAYDGIFNFSYFPLRLISKMGFFSILISVFYMAFILVQTIKGVPIPTGFTTLIFAIILFSGVQLISLGIIGEYLARIYMQVKNRPLFIIEKKISRCKIEHG
jgi:dolichol-phosphate mannosyltransferase